MKWNDIFFLCVYFASLADKCANKMREKQGNQLMLKGLIRPRIPSILVHSSLLYHLMKNMATLRKLLHERLKYSSVTKISKR